jgi:hypothetical protein
MLTHLEEFNFLSFRLAITNLNRNGSCSVRKLGWHDLRAVIGVPDRVGIVPVSGCVCVDVERVSVSGRDNGGRPFDRLRAYVRQSGSRTPKHERVSVGSKPVNDQKDNTQNDWGPKLTARKRLCLDVEFHRC